MANGDRNAACVNLLQSMAEPDTMAWEGKPLATQNLNEVQRELAEVERRLTPLLNAIRAIQGKRPVFVPKQ